MQVVGEDGGQAVVLANVSDKPVEDLRLDGIEDGAWVDALSGTGVDVAGGALAATLGPSQVCIFVKRSS